MALLGLGGTACPAQDDLGDGSGWDCPEAPLVPVGLEDDTLGFSMARAMAEANARSPAELHWVDGGSTGLALVFAHDGGPVRIPDPEFVPAYDDPEQEAWCQAHPTPAWARAALELHLVTDDGLLDEVVSVELPARLDDAGAIDLGGFDFGLEADEVGGTWTPPPSYATANYDSVVLDVSGRYAEPGDIYLDEVTVLGQGNGTIWGHATKASGHDPSQTCPANHGSVCDFPVAYFTLPDLPEG